MTTVFVFLLRNWTEWMFVYMHSVARARAKPNLHTMCPSSHSIYFCSLLCLLSSPFSRHFLCCFLYECTRILHWHWHTLIHAFDLTRPYILPENGRSTKIAPTNVNRTLHIFLDIRQDLFFSLPFGNWMKCATCARVEWPAFDFACCNCRAQTIVHVHKRNSHYAKKQNVIFNKNRKYINLDRKFPYGHEYLDIRVIIIFRASGQC